MDCYTSIQWLVRWPLMGRHLVQRGRAWAGCRPVSPLLTVPNVTVHPSMASVPTLYYSMWHYNSFALQRVTVMAVLNWGTFGSGGQFSPSLQPHNLATGFRPRSETMVSAELYSHGTGTLRCLQKEMATYRHWSVSLWRDSDDVPYCQILSPYKTEWRLISATLCGRRRCFVADQLWFMTRIREDSDTHLAR